MPLFLRESALFLLVLMIAASRCALGSEALKDIEYARVAGTALQLDLYKAADVQRPPLIVWVHGGAWRSGSKEDMPLRDLLPEGYAIASIDYRLSPVAPFPAQVHDIKTAIRFLRARGKEFGVDAKKIVIAGASAGGHLAALAGVTNGHRELEGDVGDHEEQSSDVQGIISFFGAANLTTILQQSTPHGLKVRMPALDLFLGGQPEANLELAKLASPVFHVDANDPPLLLIHGDQDPQMPINQSHEFEGAYEANGCRVHLEVVHGGAHGGKAFYDEKRLAVVRRFLSANFSNVPAAKINQE